MEATDLLIQDLNSPRSASPSPLAATVPTMPTPIQTSATFQGDSSSNFQMIVLSHLFLLVNMTQYLGERLTKVTNDVVGIKLKNGFGL